MILPRGITGFDLGVDAVATAATVPGLREFRADCWQVAIQLNAKVENCKTEKCASFVSHLLVWPDAAIVVLLSNSYPVLALCQSFQAGTIAFEFVDNARVTELFSELGEYDIWTKDTLDLPLKNEMWKELGPSEKRRVKYFRKGVPKRVGDVVFSHWD